ncbi:Imm10 family immunity protein [Nonomuraea typhae]|uniref:Imm10 family immunity protein n=1 Tax=Nonomuraea typhae TaxID=2603600 RepID=UPI0012F91D8B|nr:Imm10 family immunity protein [Nonomuraea typhae]
MTVTFTAHVVSVDDCQDYDCLSAGVAEARDGTGMAFVFLCSTEPNEQGDDLSWDTHCVVTADQRTAYGAVEEITLRDNKLLVTLDLDALETLDLPSPYVEIVLDSDDVSIERFRQALRRIMTYGRVDARPRVIDL